MIAEPAGSCRRADRGARLPWCPVALTLGIVGLPNVGKSTLFNALTSDDVLAANYPFATIEPNVGVVPLPDPRLAVLAEMFALGQDRAGDGVLRGHRRHRQGRQRGRGAGQQVPGQHPRGGRDLPGHPGVRRPRRGARRRPGRPARRHRDDQHRADPGRPADAGEGDAAAGEGGPQRARTAGPALEAAQQAARRCWTAGRTLFAARADVDLGAAARAVAADHEAVPVRLQRRRGRAHRRRAARGAGRSWSPRPTRCSWTPRSRPSCSSWTRSRRASCWSRSARTSRGCTRWPAPASTRWACRPT